MSSSNKYQSSFIYLFQKLVFFFIYQTRIRLCQN